MITCDEAGNIVIRINNDAYDLSNSNQYADFLLWATSPVENAIPDEGATPDEDAAPDENEAPGKNSTIDADAFKVDDDIPEDHRAKRRQDKLTEMAKTLTTEQRENEIQAFIKRLKSEET